MRRLDLLTRRAARAVCTVGLVALGACADRPAQGAAAAPPGGRVVSLHGVDLTGAGFDYGDPNAPVTVIEFSDFGCGYCALFALETYPELERDYVDAGTVYWKQVPFITGMFRMFPNSVEAARTAECAAEQGAYPAMHDRLYSEQRAWKRTGDADALFGQLARQEQLDSARFAACYTSGRTDQRTARNTAAAQQLGVRATPTFFVNGRKGEGALPLDVFRRVLTEAAAQKGRER
jgi:protein-disulfide isomerase